jgi:predicted protein tyrosine phosphatase
MKPWIANMGLREAEKFKPDEELSDTVCVSITEPANKRGYGHLANISQGYVGILRLQFEDYDSLRLHPPDSVLFTETQAKMVAEFVTRHRGENILVHCAAGISRSGAIVDAILQAFPEYEDRGKTRFPNGHVRSLMKRALGLVPSGFIEEPFTANPRIRFTEG